MDYKLLIWVVLLIIYAIKQFMKLTSVKSTQKEVVVTVPKPVNFPKDSGNFANRKIEEKPKQSPKTQRQILSHGVEEKLRERNKQLAPIKKLGNKEIAGRDKRSLEIIDYDDNIVSDLTLAEKAQQEMREKTKLQKLNNPSLEDAHFEQYSIHHHTSSSILKKLTNPQDLREAIILGEILNRKY